LGVGGARRESRRRGRRGGLSVAGARARGGGPRGVTECAGWLSAGHGPVRRTWRGGSSSCGGEVLCGVGGWGRGWSWRSGPRGASRGPWRGRREGGGGAEIRERGGKWPRDSDPGRRVVGPRGGCRVVESCGVAGGGGWGGGCVGGAWVVGGRGSCWWLWWGARDRRGNCASRGIIVAGSVLVGWARWGFSTGVGRGRGVGRGGWGLTFVLLSFGDMCVLCGFVCWVGLLFFLCSWWGCGRVAARGVFFVVTARHLGGGVVDTKRRPPRYPLQWAANLFSCPFSTILSQAFDDRRPLRPRGRAAIGAHAERVGRRVAFMLSICSSATPSFSEDVSSRSRLVAWPYGCVASRVLHLHVPVGLNLTCALPIGRQPAPNWPTTLGCANATCLDVGREPRLAPACLRDLLPRSRPSLRSPCSSCVLNRPRRLSAVSMPEFVLQATGVCT